jgi:hypothetical protein
MTSPITCRSYTNFKHTDWKGFIKATEEAISKLADPTDCARDKQKFCNILLDASRYRTDSVSGLPNSAKHLIFEHDKLRARDQADPNIPALNNCITEAINTANRQSWTSTLESSSFKMNPTKCWSLFKSLLGKNSCPPPNQPITFKGKAYTKALDIAKHFCKFYTSPVVHKTDPRIMKVMRGLGNKHKLDRSFQIFTPLATRDAIMTAKSSTATGPDGLTSIHLRHLGPCAINNLTKLYNLSVRVRLFQPSGRLPSLCQS